MGILLKALFLSICLLCSSNINGYANHHHHSHSHIVSVNSLLPTSVCNRTPLPQGSGKTSLEVVRKYGPCSTLTQGKASLEETLRRDQQRFHLKNGRRLQKSNPEKLKQLGKEFTFPARINNTAVDEYYTVVAFGEPKQYVSLLLDTGSDLTWTQCKPCIHCTQQRDPYFDPSKSKSFSKIPCNSTACNLLHQLSPTDDNCGSKECPYNVSYVDGSGYRGFWAIDRLTIEETNGNGYFEQYPFIFGCTNNSTGDQNGASGIMGLDRSPISILSQTNITYFSYCLPSPYGSTGYISFGKPHHSLDDAKNKFIKFTPIVTTPLQSEFYDITLTGISVGGQKLPFNTSYFTKLNSLIDSGNVITRLPSPVYTALRSAFRKRMLKYKMTTKPVGDDDVLDTCYDLSSYETVVVPKISFHFLGGVDLELDVRGTLVVDSVRHVCLGFAVFPSDSISLGNVQQRGYEWHYDLAGRRLGFGPGNCS